MTYCNVKGNRPVRCHCGCNATMPFNTTIEICPDCGMYIVRTFYGAVIGIDGNYVY